MKLNVKSLSEKTLKTFLKKKKVGYSESLLISFLITGAMLLGSNVELLSQVNQNQEALLMSIATQKSEIIAMIVENEARLNELKARGLSLLNEGDWYSKPWRQSNFASLGLTLTKADNQNKKWITSNREDTQNDRDREAYGNYNKYEYKGTGWIMNTDTWNSFTEVYDNVAKLTIIPVLTPPEVMSPSAPNVNFSIPKIPANINTPTLQAIPTVNVLTNVTQPNITISSMVTPDVDDINVNVADQNINMGTITVNINPNTPTFNINPLMPSITMSVKTPDSIIAPNPEVPNRIINPVNPDANPFSDFHWEWLYDLYPSPIIARINPYNTGAAGYPFMENVDITGGIFWSGVDKDGNISIVEAGYEGAAQDTTNWNASGFISSVIFDRRHYTIINSYHGRWTGQPGNKITGGTFHVAGDIAEVGSEPVRGTAAFHLVGDVHLENVTANLYGKAAFINAETFRGGQITMDNVTINVEGNENTVFNLSGSGPHQDLASFSSTGGGQQYATKFSGNANITVDTLGNTIYAVKRFAGGLKIENLDTITLNGASNVGVSFLTWVPDKSKYIGEAGAGNIDELGGINDYIPYVKLDPNKPMKLNGDENVGIFFNSQSSDFAFNIGIHQGYFDLFFDIGTMGASGTNENLDKTDYTTSTVDGSVGVYAISGQRTGVDYQSMSAETIFSLDPIHNLMMDNFVIRFGKDSKNGFMFLSKNGTVIEIEDIKTPNFSDGINGASTSESDASVGTIIAYAEGTWTAAGTGLTGITPLEGSPTEIIVGKELHMSSKDGIAFFADDGGKITVTKDSTGYGHRSIMAYARDGGRVEVAAGVKITATDNNNDFFRTNKYENIGAYSGAGGNIIINGNVDIHGIGAFANGTAAAAHLMGNGNIINTGINGGLVALNGGYIEFNGGTIIHKEISSGSHDGKIAIYADNNGSKVNFTGATSIEVHNGAVFYGEASDYNGAAGITHKYNGMNHVTVELMEHGINLGVFNGENITWSGETSYLAHIAGIPQVNAINHNNHWYSSYLEGGTMVVNADVNLDGGSSGSTKGSDAFNDIIMEREKVTINPGIKVESLSGNGLVLGSNIEANRGSLKNMDSGYTNNGQVSITGGNQVGIYTSYGYVNNTNTGAISVDTGIAVAGVNGSVITNAGNIQVNAPNQGIGIVGLARRIDTLGNPDTPESYGTDVSTGADADITTNLVQINNQGAINVIGTNGIGIYADNNISGSTNRIIVNNSGTISIGDGGVGVMVKGATDGGIISLTNVGTSGITVGIGGIGVYGEKSIITLAGAPYTITTKDNGIGILVESNSTINAGSLKLDYIGSDDGTATGVVYRGLTGETLNNGLDIEISTPPTMKNTVTGIYASNGGNIINTGDITVTTGRAYGILSQGVDVDNHGTLTVGASGGNGGIGIYAEDAAIKTEGKNIVVNGRNGIGVYVLNTGGLSVNKKIEINHNTTNLQVTGEEAVGIYVKDIYGASRLVLENNENIDITPSTTAGDRKVGIFLENAQNVGNENSGDINMIGSATSGYNVGIYTKDSILAQNGIINVSGTSNVGIYAQVTGTNINILNLLNNTTINIKTSTMSDGDVSIGIYGKGDNITIQSSNIHINVESNSQGIYLDGNGTTKITGIFNFDLQSDISEKVGIGAHFRGGSYANSGTTAKLTSSLSSTSTITGEIVRPIGLYYGVGSTKNEGNIEILSGTDSIIGLYGSSISSFNNIGNIKIDGNGIGAYYSNSNVINSGKVEISADNSYGLFFSGGNSSSTGIVEILNGANKSLGVVSKGVGTFYANQGLIQVRAISSIGIAATNGGYARNSSVIEIYNDGYGIVSTDAVSEIELILGSLIEEKTSASTWRIGAAGVKNGKVTLNGGTINMLSNSIGILLSQGNGELISGDIEVSNNGIGVSAEKNSTLDMTLYNGKIKIGDSGIAIYSSDSMLGAGGTLNVDYMGYVNKGVGIYYTSETSGSAVTNDISIFHTGNNLVGIYADDINLTNRANQLISDSGIGIYGTNNAIISNSGTLTIDGDNSIGIYLGNNSSLVDIGQIVETSQKSNQVDYKIGVYVENGDVLGNSTYDFDIAGGIAMYLKNDVVSYNGKINLKGDSIIHSPGVLSRSIGVYVGSTVAGTLETDINVTGANGIGLYLEENLGAASNIIYNGNITITSASTGEKGLGAYLSKNSSLTLGSGGSMAIGGTENIGFYVDEGATLNVSDGNVTNTADGIFAYIKNGNVIFASGTTPNINFVNIIVSGTFGALVNETDITVGTSGLQATSGGDVKNTTTGIINGAVNGAIAVAGEGALTIVDNQGQIKLTGDKSVGLYLKGGATGTSSGRVEVGRDGVAYYADTNGSITVTGTGKVGIDGALMYSTGGTINYLGSDIIGDNQSSVAVIENTNSLIDLNNRDISVGEMGIGIFVTGTASSNNIQNVGKISVGREATGIFLNSGVNETLNHTIELIDTEATGILTTQNGDIIYNGNMNSSKLSVKGIVSTGINKIINNGTIKLTGQSSVGIYGEQSTQLTNALSGLIEVGSGTEVSASVGIYGKEATAINNAGTIKLNSHGVGIFGENSIITNTGTIQNATGNNTGIYGKNSGVSNSGNITLGQSSNGIYTENGMITNTGTVAVGDNKSSGLYGGGTSAILHQSGLIKVGNNSVGIAIDGGSITVLSGAQIQAGEGSTYIYSITGEGKIYENLTLNKYGVGLYTKLGKMGNYGTIVVGESDISSSTVKVSVAMATESGELENNGRINIIHDNGVGMLSNNGGKAINNGTINAAGNDTYGMQATNGSTLVNNGEINVTGSGARGIVAIQNSTVENNGTINVFGTSSEGIYIESGSEAINKGIINVDGTGRVGLMIGAGGKLTNKGTIHATNGALGQDNQSQNVSNIGDIKIEGPKISIDGAIIDNIGNIIIDGSLDFNTVKLAGNGTNDYVGTISADSFKNGEFIILSDVTQGSNKGAYIIQYLQSATNIPNSGNITGISQSVSYVVDLQKDPTDPNKISIVLVKIPYTKMMEGTKATEFGKGLDELYYKSTGRELSMFDSLDMISNDDELAATFENELRGNEYANIQDRMMDINEVFNNAYENLKHDKLYTKDSLKIGLISSRGESKYRDPAIIDYDQTSLGFMAMKEYDTRTYGQKYGWHLGFAQNKFELDTDSKETVYSLNIGTGYERILGGNDRLKWNTIVELTANAHKMDRKIDISGTRYSNRSDYLSTMATIKNKVRYEEVTESGKIKVGIQGMFDLGYGRYFDIKEKGDGMFLELPSIDMYSIRPGIGTDVTFIGRRKNGSKISLSGKASLEYELGKIYDGPNKARFKGTNTDYYSLEKPNKEEIIGKIGAELKYETISGSVVGFEIVRQEGRRDNTRYGVNLMMRLGN